MKTPDSQDPTRGRGQGRSSHARERENILTSTDSVDDTQGIRKEVTVEPFKTPNVFGQEISPPRVTQLTIGQAEIEQSETSNSPDSITAVVVPTAQPTTEPASVEFISSGELSYYMFKKNSYNFSHYNFIFRFQLYN